MRKTYVSSAQDSSTIHRTRLSYAVFGSQLMPCVTICYGKSPHWIPSRRRVSGEKLSTKLMHIALEASQGFDAPPACPRQFLAPLLYRHNRLFWSACRHLVQD